MSHLEPYLDVAAKLWEILERAILIGSLELIGTFRACTVLLRLEPYLDGE